MPSLPRSTRQLALAALLGSGGFFAAICALNLRLLSQTGSLWWLVAGLMVTRLAMALGAPLGGWLADHVDRRRLAASCDVLCGLVLASLVVLDSPILLVAACAVVGVCSSPSRPALLSLVAAGTEPKQMARATGLVGGAYASGALIGPLVAGPLFSLVGSQAVLASTLCSLLGAGLVWTSGMDGRPRRAAARAHQGLGAGMRYARGHAWIVWLLVMTAVGSCTSGLINAAEAPLGLQLGGGWAYGLISASSGLGATLASFAVRGFSPGQLWSRPSAVVIISVQVAAFVNGLQGGVHDRPAPV